MRSFDVVVLGLGGIGSAALCQLAGRGVTVLGIDQFGPAHAQGSSHGQTRLFRTAYFEHADYVPLLRRAAVLWNEREHAEGRRLFARTGVLLAGPPAGEVLTGATAAASQHGIVVERQPAADAMSRWPALQMPADWMTLYEPNAGCLFVEAAVQAQLNAATAAGAEVRHGLAVRQIKAIDHGVELHTETERIVAGRLVFCPGPWAGQLLPLPGLSPLVLRKSLFWYRPAEPSEFSASALPCIGYDTPQGFFYATPAFDFRGVKVAEHSGGRPLASPAEVSRAIDAREQAAVEAWSAGALPGLGRDRTGHTACFYTMTPDRHAVVGHHPDHPRVTVAVGFSGHGFKLAPVIGEALADLACDGTTDLPIDFLSPRRF